MSNEGVVVWMPNKIKRDKFLRYSCRVGVSEQGRIGADHYVTAYTRCGLRRRALRKHRRYMLG